MVGAAVTAVSLADAAALLYLHLPTPARPGAQWTPVELSANAEAVCARLRIGAAADTVHRRGAVPEDDSVRMRGRPAGPLEDVFGLALLSGVEAGLEPAWAGAAGEPVRVYVAAVRARS